MRVPQCGKRQLHCHGRALSLSLAMRHNCTAMHFCNAPDDIEAKPEAAVLPRSRRIALFEPIEHEWQEVRVNALAGIAHAYVELISTSSKIDADLAVLFSELQRIRQQVIDNLLQPV